ncbi:MAG TPA: fibronectin type III domain-containing protein [Anaeromyxobacter sp.]|nr:fibronectin type III domain-containing protein [Anaeromyxobacter sp.]
MIGPASGHTRRFTFIVAVAALVSLVVISACSRDGSSRSAVAPAVAPAPPPAPPAAPSAPDLSPPTQPQRLEAVASPGAAELTWTGSSDDIGVEGYDVLRDDVAVAKVAAPQAHDAGLQPGRRYCYRVVAFDAAGHRSEPSEPSCVLAPDTAPPTVPGALSVEAAGPRAARLSWTASSDDVGVTAYEVLRDGRPVATTKEPVARVAGVAPGRRDCFTVRALDAAGNRSEPSAPACLEVPDVTPPTTPGALAAEPRPGQVALKWTASQDDVAVVAYEVLRDGHAIAKVGGTFYSDPELRAGVRYCYGVVALDAAGNRSAASAPACATPPDVTPPTAPTDVLATAEGETVVSLRWKASSDDVGVVRYEVLHEQAITSTSTSARVTRLRAGTEYCFRVRAYDAAGNGSAPSAPACATTPDLTPPSQVTHVVARAESDRRVRVEWHAARDNVGVKEYAILRDGAASVIAPGDVTTMTDEGLSPATRYCYTVTASDAAGNASAPSQPTCVTTPDLVPPTLPPALAVIPRSPTEVVATWGASTDDVGVAGYELLRDDSVVATIDAGTGLEAVVGELDPATESCLAVRAFDAAGNRSQATKPACARTPDASTPAAPWKLRAAKEPKELVLSWQPSENPNIVYVVYWDTKRGAERPIGTTPSRTFKVFGAAAQERHCYRVSARDESSTRESPRSFPVCAQLKSSLAAADVRSPEQP